ncbi:MAG: hydrogenase maturation protease [Ardenticatenaceae bacterium]|nr:hydrogenase maturation protease [Ardenticatenaceae bacterium]
MKILVLALGNPLRGDDGVGSAVLAALGETAVLPPHIKLIDGGTPGLETALTLQGYDKVIVIDAANLGEAPGTWRRFSLAEANLVQQAQMNGTLHDAGFAEAVALGVALDILPPEIIVYGVQPETIEWEMGLSTAVRTAIPKICQQIQAELAEILI